MSFINTNAATGKGWNAGHFLVDDEDCTRLTAEIAQNHAQVITRADGSKYVPAGAIIPSNDGNAVGILYEDTDVTVGNMPGSIVTRGAVYEDKLPASAESSAKSALTGIQFTATSPAIERPNFDVKMLALLTVNSIAGTAAGDTKITVSGYTKASTDLYKYKVADAAQAVQAGDKLSAWTTWDGSADITATTGKKITVAVTDAKGYALAAGSATVTAKA